MELTPPGITRWLSACTSESVSRWLIWCLAVSVSLLALYIALFGSLIAHAQRGLLLLLTIGMVFLQQRARKGDRNPPSGLDWCLFGAVVVTFGYMVINAYEIAAHFTPLAPLKAAEIVIGSGGILLVLEATRRLFGVPLTIIAAFTLVYAYFGTHLPGVWGFRAFSTSQIIKHVFYSTEGVFGSPVGVTASIVAIYVVFGAFLDKSGAGKTFIDLAMGSMGHMRGGPAKTAVVGSAAMGTVSGSVTANIVTTGTFTIPLMIRSGFRPVMAAATESLASTGAQIMPPIMGTAAFLVAEYSGHRYADVALAAFLPSVLFYTSLFVIIHLTAARDGLGGIPRSELPNSREVLRNGFLHFIPILLLIYPLVMGYSAKRAALWALAGVIAVSMLKKQTRMTWRTWLGALESAGHGILIPAVSCAAAGVIIGVFSLTGLGLKFSSIVISLSGGSLLMAMFLTMIAALILGMGLPTPAAYLIQAVFTIPALIQLGAPVMAAHLFALYFSVLSFITPPVAIGAYAAAGIARSNPVETGYVAFRMSIVAFIVPYMFVFGPALLFDGASLQILSTFVTAMIGVCSLGAAIVGWMVTVTPTWQRLALLAAALLLVNSYWATDIAGFLLLAPVVMAQYTKRPPLRIPVAGKESGLR